MMNLVKRSYQKELLDQDNIPFKDIKDNMQELNFINTWLGGHSITISGLKKLLADKKRIKICEIGCGGGDNLEAIQKWCSAQKIELSCIGIDIKKECIDFACTKEILSGNTEWICSNYADIVFKEKPDIIFSSLFCHHFTNNELNEQLIWMQRNAGIGFFINDLQRHWLAYYSIKILTRIFSSSYLVKNDAPLSVARGFKEKDWKEIFKSANLNPTAIKWKWAFRYLIIYEN